MTVRSPYEVLGVNAQASADDLKNSYRRLAKKFHPDLNPGNKEAESKFKELNEAYEKVSSPEARAKFDSGEADAAAYRAGGGPGEHPFYSQTQGRPGGGRYSQHYSGDWGGEGDGGNFFESLFGGARGAGGPGFGARGAAPEPERDTHFRMEVEFREAALGAEREIQLPNGKRLRVKIPGGIETGRKLRFAGQGQTINKKTGDAYIEIQVMPHAQFKRVGDNVESEVDLPFPVAAVGGEWRIPTLDGAVVMKIPAGSSHGARLRIRGKGIVKAADKSAVKAEATQPARGDQIVSLRLVTPPDLDEGLRTALREWVSAHPVTVTEADGS